MDERHIKIKGEIYWLWRDVDKDGIELDICFKKGETPRQPYVFSDVY